MTLPHSIFVSYDSLSRAPVRVSAAPVLQYRPDRAPAANPPPSVFLDSSFYFVRSAFSSHDNATYLPCPSRIIKPTGGSPRKLSQVFFLDILFCGAALISNRALKVTRCIHEVRRSFSRLFLSRLLISRLFHSSIRKIARESLAPVMARVPQRLLLSSFRAQQTTSTTRGHLHTPR